MWSESCMSFGKMLIPVAWSVQGRCLQKLNHIGFAARKPTALQKPWIRDLFIGSPSPWDAVQPAEISGSLCHIECRRFIYSNPSYILFRHLDLGSCPWENTHIYTEIYSINTNKFSYIYFNTLFKISFFFHLNCCFIWNIFT